MCIRDSLYSIQMKLAGMMRRLTDCIRFNDMTQNFQPPFKSKMMVELADELSQTLRLFRGRLLEEEIKHQYYENLLNKVDTAVVVTDRSGRVEWMNRAAVALVGQESRLPQEWLTTSWNETQVVRIRQQGASVEMAVSCTLFAAQNKERLLVSLKNIHSVLELSLIHISGAYTPTNIRKLRAVFGTYLLLGLEFLIASDILKTVLEPTMNELIILGGIVVVRTILSVFLNKEIKELETENN